MPALTYGLQDIVNALQASGLQSGDTAFFSTSLGMFGIAQGVQSADDLNALFFTSIQQVLGPKGTMLVPSYSYTFGKSRLQQPAVFHLQQTPAEIGPFPDFMRRQPLARRSPDPMTSVVGIGPLCDELFADLPNNSYGKDCLFQRLLDYPVKCCNIGLGPNWMAFIHHVDWRHQVPFRFDKLFYGIIDDGEQKKETDWLYAVPVLQPNAVANTHAVARQSEAAGIWQIAPLARNQIYTADYRRYFDFVNPLVKQNRWSLATGPVIDVLQAERARAQETPFHYALDLSDAKAFVAAIEGTMRAAASDNVDALLNEIKKQLPISIQNFASGKHVAGHVIPEKWRVVNFSIRDQQQTEWAHQFLINHYSLSFSGSLSGEALVDWCSCLPAAPTAKPEITYDHKRAVGLACSQMTLDQIQAAHQYEVVLETCFYYGNLSIGVFEYSKNAQQKIVICAYIGGTYGATDKLTGAYIACQLIAGLHANSIQSRVAVTILLVPDDKAVAYWLATQPPSEIDNIKLVLSLRGIGDHGGLQLFSSGLDPRFYPVQTGGLVEADNADLLQLNQLPQAVLSHADVSQPMPFAEFASDLDNHQLFEQHHIDEARERIINLLENS